MRSRTERTGGFTLIELLVVLGIVVVLATIVAVVTLRMQERDQVPRASTLLQGALAQAKARAMAERQNIGVRLVLRLNRAELLNNPVDVDGDGQITIWDLNQAANTPAKIKDANQNGVIDYADVLTPPGNPPGRGGFRDGNDDDQNGWTDDLVLCDQIEFIRDPGNFTDGAALGSQGNTTIDIMRSAPELDLQDLRNFVQAGDWIEFNGNGQLYQITGVTHTGLPTPGNQLTLDRPLAEDLGTVSNFNTGTMASYRILRQPRPIPGEKPIKLPDGAVLDMLLSQVPLSVQRTIDIMFSPGGNVVGEAGAQDMMFLWVHDARTGNVDNQVLVTVYPKTGAVLIFPVDLTGTDMYSFARTGRAANTP